ncbi:subunit 17 of mediator complex-domain-containing protein [Xylariaceae sp. FL0255]|nr:subunit 17 of mediator complex-domain-containing protein [Xylariaceae sp. FL0255]
MSSDNQSPFSLRPWPISDKKPKSIGEFIARLNAQPGGFRGLNQAQLQRDIDAQEQGQGDEDGPSEDESDEGEKPKTAIAARDEFLKNIEVAHQSAMLALDTVSLLLSKESPVQASTTLSPMLRDLVGIGTMGASKLNETTFTEAQQQDELTVAIGWRLVGINKAVDSVLAAAERLEKEMELEAKYWADVLAVSDDGWSVCSLPKEKHVLGVRFGFAESTPSFRDSSIAPLIRKDDGSIDLGFGKWGRGSQRIRITVKKDGVITDQSPLPQRLPDDVPMKARVREARDTIFHQELWYELNREARILLASNVCYDGPAVVWKQDSHTQYIFTLEDLDEADSAHVNLEASTESCLANYTFLQFLLFQTHRQTYNRRTSPSVMTRQANPPTATHNILRSFISRLEYVKNNSILSKFLSDVVATLQRAGIHTASYTSTFPNLQAAQSRQDNNYGLIWVHQLFNGLATNFTLNITPEARIWCRGQSLAQPIISSMYLMALKDPSGGDKAAPPNPLEDICPATPFNEPYPNVQEAIYYLSQAVTRAISYKLAATLSEELGSDDIKWTDTIGGAGITNSKGKTARFIVGAEDEGKNLRVETEVRGYDGNVLSSRNWSWTPSSDNIGGESIHASLTNFFKQGDD